MNVGPNTTGHLRLSLLQVMKLVVFCGVAFACLAPMLHLWQAGGVQGGTPQGLVSVALFEAVVVPLVWAGLSFAVVRRGVWRDGLISALLLCSVLAALGIAGWLFFAYAIPAYRDPYGGVGLSSLVLCLMTILVLATATAFLTVRLSRWRMVETPDAQSRALDPTNLAVSDGQPPPQPR